MRAMFGLLAALPFAASPVMAEDAAAFYKNKTVNIVVGFSSGGGYDAYARLLARHYGKHAPGSPNFIVQNMPGAGSLTAVRSVDTKPPFDGTNIVAFNPGLIIEGLVNSDRTNFSFKDIAWLGSITKDFRVCYAWGATGVKTWDDLRQRKEFVFGATAPGSSSYMNSSTLRSLFGINVKQVLGYPGSAEMRIAIQTGELHGDCGPWSAITPEWRRNAKINAFVRFSRDMTPDMPPEARFIGDFAATQEQKDLIDFLIAPNELGVPYALSKKVPPERIAALRTAFDATMKDRDFLADAEKMTFPVAPVTGAEAEEIVKRIYTATPDLIRRAADAVK